MEPTPVVFEQGDTMVEFIRVVAEQSVRKGFEIGFASAFVFATKDKGQETDYDVLVGLTIARKIKPSLDIHWQWTERGQMLVVDAGQESREEPTQIVGVSHRTYNVLHDLEVTNEPLEDDDGGTDD